MSQEKKYMYVQPHSDGERRKNDTKEVAAINNEFGV